ncbi:integral membrane protein [Corynebacterium mustelae]|uniref:Integral membrane protein n=1 Tax=Corynebacterium mustelae TaxID=571915 RepID=A0A0G3GZW0_9CORY|nr:DUF3817 domain-containing protein [Corynebacterium mustelae]AKK06080.1 integral membrane protein [Corynebacterium mustelae]
MVDYSDSATIGSHDGVFSSPRRLHRVVAFIEMGTWTFLIVGMVLKYSGVTEAVVPIAGSIHGFGFLCFVFVTIGIWINDRWDAPWGIAGLAVSAIPWAALPFTIVLDRRGMLSDSWRFRRGDSPRSVSEKILAIVVRNPVVSCVVLAVIVAVVFSILLYLGPPVDVEGVLTS